MVATATERKCVACRKKDADTGLEWEPFCFGCLNRAGDAEEIRVGVEVVCETDSRIRGGVVRIDDDHTVVIQTKHRHEVVPLASVIAVL